jgi:hypothetical protein
MNVYEETMRIREVGYTTASTGLTTPDVATPGDGTISMFMMCGSLCYLTDDGELMVAAHSSTGVQTYAPVVHGYMDTNGTTDVAATIAGVTATSQALIVGTSSAPVGTLTLVPTTDTLTLDSTSESDTGITVHFLCKK